MFLLQENLVKQFQLNFQNAIKINLVCTTLLRSQNMFGRYEHNLPNINFQKVIKICEVPLEIQHHKFEFYIEE